MKEDACVQPPVRLCLTVGEDLLQCFCLLGGSGFTIRARTPCSVAELLCGQLGVAADYLAGRVQTIFLDGSVVDDPATATVAAGSTIALSAALPGVAGAVLRKDSSYAAMRRTISHANRVALPAAARQGRIVVKLFNMVQGELGPAMLGRGVQVSGKALCDLFRGRSETFRSGILKARIDDRSVPLHVPLETDWTDQDIFLQVGS